MRLLRWLEAEQSGALWLLDIGQMASMMTSTRDVELLDALEPDPLLTHEQRDPKGTCLSLAGYLFPRI